MRDPGRGSRHSQRIQSTSAPVFGKGDNSKGEEILLFQVCANLSVMMLSPAHFIVHSCLIKSSKYSSARWLDATISEPNIVLLVHVHS